MGVAFVQMQEEGAAGEEERKHVLTIVQLEGEEGRPKILHQKLLEQLLPLQQATSLDFSACSSFLLLGFSYTKQNQDDLEAFKEYPVAHVYRTKDCECVLVHRSDVEDNCSNNARFIGSPEVSTYHSDSNAHQKFLYGTVGGRVVMVRPLHSYIEQGA